MADGRERIEKAYQTARAELLRHQSDDGFWTGELSASALSTATAVSALSLYLNAGQQDQHAIIPDLVQKSVDYLAAHQNEDGGWGDTVKSFSNIATTYLVKSALTLSNFRNEKTVAECDGYIRQVGAFDGLRRRYGKDQTFVAPILTNAALAGLVDWKEVPQLPFERASLPMSLFRLLRLQVVSYAIPALVAIGQVRHHFYKESRQPLRNFWRNRAISKTLKLIEKMQPESGGYLEAIPLTSFVVMSLCACGHAGHPIVQNGVRFLLQTAKDDGSWPIDTNLATWLTSLATVALGDDNNDSLSTRQFDWLLSCQHTKRHPFTGAQPGGWGWTNLSGAVPDADDTAGALLALTTFWSGQGEMECRSIQATCDGIRWLLGLQNSDGGMPTFCRGWGVLPFDQSSTDITAHVLRTFNRCSVEINEMMSLAKKMSRSAERMWWFLRLEQYKEGYWLPLWFGNQHRPDESNPFYGTAKVLKALIEVTQPDGILRHQTKNTKPMIDAGIEYLVQNQNADGGWGNAGPSSIEETALCVETLASYQEPQVERSGTCGSRANAYHRGVEYLVNAVESGTWTLPAPIGLYFAKLWYFEKLYPIIFTTGALRSVISKDLVSHNSRERSGAK